MQERRVWWSLQILQLNTNGGKELWNVVIEYWLSFWNWMKDPIFVTWTRVERWRFWAMFAVVLLAISLIARAGGYRYSIGLFSENAEVSLMSSEKVSLYSSGAPSSVCSSLKPGHGQTPRPLEEITYGLQVKRQPIDSVMIYQYLHCRFQRVKKTKIVCWPGTNTPGIKKRVGTRGGGGGDLEGHRLPYHGTFHGIPNPGSTTFKHESMLFHCNCCAVCRYEMLKLTE